MGSLLRAVHFFRVVPPLPRLMLWSFAVLTSAAAVALVLDPHQASSVTLPVLALQVFATSTGFTMHARRGHYDLLLTEGLGRARMGFVQWGIAAAPGVASWCLIVVAELVIAGSHRSLQSGTVAALFLVSTVPWAVTVALPRFSGAIGWMLLGVMVRTLPTPETLDAPWHSSDPRWVSTLRFLLFPSRAAGVDVANDLASVLPALIAAALSMALALLWLRRTTLPLESGQ